MDSKFTMRKTELTDLDALVEMRIALLREVGNVRGDEIRADLAALIEAHRQYFRDNLATGKYLGFVAEIDSKIIGTGGLVLMERPPHRENPAGLEAYLMNVFTVRSYRGRGVATAIVQGLLAAARSVGARRVWLHAEPEARRLYEKAGFLSKTSEMELIL